MIAVFLADGRADLLGHLANVFEIDLLAIERRTDRNHRQIAVDDRLFEFGGGLQFAIGHQPLEHRLEADLIDWRVTGVDTRDLLGHHIDADNIMIFIGQTNARDQTYVAGSYNRDSHYASTVS